MSKETVNYTPSNHRYLNIRQCLIAGTVGGVIVTLIGFAIISWLYNPYETKSLFIEHDQSLIYNPNISITDFEKGGLNEIQLLFDNLKEQKVILTPHEYTSHLGTYYNSLIAVLISLFVVFSLISFFSIKGFAKNEVREAQLELDKKSAGINHVIKNEVKTVLDEMLRDSKLMHDKLDKSITGIVDDAFISAKSSFPSVDLFTELKEEVISLKKEQETQLDILLEYIEDQENRFKTVKLQENE